LPKPRANPFSKIYVSSLFYVHDGDKYKKANENIGINNERKIVIITN